MRVAIGTGVTCRAQPDRDSPVVAFLRLAEPFTIGDVATDRSGGTVWYEVGGFRTSCWVFGSLTVPFEGYQNPDAALLAIAEHALALNEDAGFERLVAVDNLLLERTRRRGRYFRSPAAVPPMLELRHLQIVDRAARTIGGRSGAAKDPLTMAWVLSHSDVVTHFEPGSLYHVRGARFWELYERSAASPDAEEIAWTAAGTRVFTDECYAVCHLSVLAETHMVYWRGFPRGIHVFEAITQGVRRVERAARYCVLVSAKYLPEDQERIRTLANSLRESLSAVTAAGKDDLLAHLAEIEGTCVGSKVDLRNPMAMPGLAKALGLGFSVVARSLAAFGEDAAAAVLAVVMRAEPDTDVVGEGLTALRFMVEGTASRPLSAGTVERVQRAAAHWLSARRQSILTLGAAIDLAAVLDHPEVQRTLESLASDREAVAARGIGAESIETIRRRAAQRLAGIPPVPRP
jgi:hypothetical protein